MSVHEFHGGNPPNILAPQALALLQRRGVATPLQIALVHKRNGRWLAWRWIDVQREVERLSAALQQQGFGAGSRLAVSGAYEPTLLFFTLSAQRAGGEVVSVAQSVGAQALTALLARIRPSHAWVERREVLSSWRQADAVLPLYSLHATEGVQTLQALYGQAASSQPSVLPLHRLQRAALTWVEEGTDWQQGLSRVLEHWLTSGETLAFPEDGIAAARDRADLAPTHLLLSEARLQRLAEEIDARLPAPGTWQRRLCDWAASAPEQGLRRLLKVRVRRLLGFQRLQKISQTPLQQSRQQVWLDPRGSRAA
ncbi:AMP-binding protein [Pseudomonas sp. S37]|uniref:acyl-CoA synthetase n=1 Tax=Pseudomonas sp. S37 TaxID=2767449 RepID=UPI0019133335|nr:acyl-CoA synthetase [Pseudomonas sp. S37]MBK4992289.1 AMP-binding protein [Pseudomonas sp. S37]